jgi:predicted kinase
MEKMIYLVRGIPGSGKTTLAKQLAPNWVFEADHYFYDNDGNYNFIASEIKEAHKECQQYVGYAMESNTPKIAVSNTFTQEWELQPYYELAIKYGYYVTSIIVENRHGGINKHGVPEDKIQLMKDRFEIKI